MKFEELDYVQRLKAAEEFASLKDISTEDAYRLGEYFNGYKDFPSGGLNINVYNTLMESGDEPNTIHKKWVMLRSVRMYTETFISYQFINWYYEMLVATVADEYDPQPKSAFRCIPTQIGRILTHNILSTYRIYGFDPLLLWDMFYLTFRIKCQLPKAILKHIIDNKLSGYIVDPNSLVHNTLKLWKKEYDLSKEDMVIFDSRKGTPAQRFNGVLRGYTHKRVDNLLVARWVKRNENSSFLNKPIPVHGPGGLNEEIVMMSRIDEIKIVDLTKGIKTSPKRAFENLEARLVTEKQEGITFNEFPEPYWETPKGYIRLKDTNELVEEGERMKHCVGTLLYRRACTQGTSVIYHYGDSAPNGITIEIYSDHDGALVLGQAFGYKNINVPNKIVDKIKSDFGIE